MAGQPKPAFYLAVGAVIVALVGFAIYRSDLIAPQAPKGKGPVAGGDIKEALEKEVERSDKPKLTAEDYKVILRQGGLPPVTGVSNYDALKDNTVRFALNVWAGWAPIILANNGFEAGKTWKTPEGNDFKVELVLIDNPVQMFDAYAAGNVHIGWATLDMVPLFMQRNIDKDSKPRDSRIMPRIFQQVDWSNGGDGVVARDAIKTVADLRGKKVALAENSPSHYFALTTLIYGGVQPAEVNFVFTQDAFQAASAFNSQKDIAAAVSWAPDIYNLEKVKGNRMLVTTAQANKLIADVWFARADFAKDHPGIVEGLVRGIFDAMEELKSQGNKTKVSQLMAKGYNIQPDEAFNMLGDAHSTNWAENRDFFLDPNNTANFEHIWGQSYFVYRRVGNISHQPISFDRVMDFSVIEKLGKEPKYASQKNEYRIQFAPQTVKETRAAEKPILTNTIYIRFAPNSWDLYKRIPRTVNEKVVEELYDPSVDMALEQIAKVSGQFAASRIVIEGHTDNSMQGTVPAALVKELSLNRANAVKEALVNKYKTLDPNRFAVEGTGWDRPAHPTDQSKNRRVEVTVYTAEQPGS